MGEKKDSFRFTVQFNAGDPSHQQVAAILNEQGRRKAQFLVNAVTHYMNCPETPEAAAAPRIDRQTVEQLVREILSNMHPEPVPAVGEDMPGCDPAITAAEGIPFDAAAMLGEDGFHSLMDSLAAIQKYGKYSLGMRQRLGIACAIRERPELILLDEPFISLDEAAINLVADIIRQEKERGALIILACHDYGYLSGASDEIFKLVGGKLAHHLTKCENDVFSEVSQ